MFESLSAAPEQLLIPVFSGIIGWFTNVVAVKMMFKPTDFVGIPPFLGWQGIVPANAIRLATTGHQLVTAKLLDITELFRAFSSKELVESQEEQIAALTRQLIVDKAEAHFPAMWNALGEPVREQIFKMAQEEIKALGIRVFDDAKDKVADVLDVEGIVVRAVTQDKDLMSRVFLTVGSAEFKFIEHSGLYFGFLFGIIQLFVWLAFPLHWILPAFGFAVGYATNWMAIRLIFDPKEPVKVGPWQVQGLFHRRQKSISKEFATIMSRKMLSSENIFHALSTGSFREELVRIVEREANAVIEKYKSNPMAAGLFANPAAGDIEAEIRKAVEAELFKEGGLVYGFGDKADQIREILAERMAVMKAEDYENVLRPAFRQDEWKLIVAGAVLGLGAGVAQFVFLFADIAT